MAEDYETDFDRTFEASDRMSSLSIGRKVNGSGIEFATQDIGNGSAADVGYDQIWNVIDHLIELAGPRAFAAGEQQ